LLDNAAFRAVWSRLDGDPRIGALGATTYGVDDARAAVESGLFRSVQVEWNVLNQRVVDTVGQLATTRGVRIAVRSVYLQGALTEEGRALPAFPSLREGVERARSAARALEMPLEVFALRAALEHPHIANVLIGVDRPEQIDAARAVERRASGTTLARDVVEALDLRGDAAVDPRTWTPATMTGAR
jgi:aryl-alcohol dehydrogenase-like predicted oxidoreductase